MNSTDADGRSMMPLLRVTHPLAPPILVDSPQALSAMLAVLASEPRLALDTESDSLYRYFHKVCLIQISTGSADYLVDPLRLPDLQSLGSLLADPHIEKVFHAAENDILLLKRDFGFSFANIFDTMWAARILGRRGVGLAALLAECFGVELDKHTQLTDWGQRPLTHQQLMYAHLDTHYLLPLRDVLAEDLKGRQRWREAQECFAGLVQQEFDEKPFDPDGFWRNRGVRDLRPQEQAVYRELYLWRDRQARALNRPPFKVVTDQVLLQLSREQPRRLDHLPLSAWQIQRFGSEILAAVARGRIAPPPQAPLRPNNGWARPEPTVVACFDRLRAWRSARAAERGVDSDVVLNNESLMAIARAQPASLAELAAVGVMGPWKLETYGPEILAVVAGN